MSEDELRQLEKDVAKAKRVASDWASQIHDLVEDRFPAAYQGLPRCRNRPSRPARNGPI
jgi:hypothetical protein